MIARTPLALVALLSFLTTALAQDAAAWGEIRALKQLPRELRVFLVNDGPKGIADRNGEFNPTDVVKDPSVPMRRFVIAAMSTERLIVEVERGGRPYNVQKLEFRQVENRWVFQTRSYTDDSAREIDVREYESNLLGRPQACKKAELVLVT